MVDLLFKLDLKTCGGEIIFILQPLCNMKINLYNDLMISHIIHIIKTPRVTVTNNVITVVPR